MTEKKNILNILIATGIKPLASYSQCIGEFIQKCELYLSKVYPDTALAIKFNDFLIFYNDEDNITYLIMTSTSFPKFTAVRFLESLKKEFHDILINKNLNKISKYGLNKDFKEKLKMKFEYYNEHPEVTNEDDEFIKEKMLKIKDKIDEEINFLNVDKNKKTEMENKAENLENERNFNFFKISKIKMDKEKNQKRKMILIIIGIIPVILIIAYLIIGFICNWDFKC